MWSCLPNTLVNKNKHMVYKYHMCRGIWPPNFSMWPLSGSALDQVLSLIQSGHNAHEISSATGYHTSTITQIWSKHCPDIPEPTGGHPCKLSPTDVHCLINSGKADNAPQVTHTLQTITNKSLSCETIWKHLKKEGLKAVVKKKHPMLTMHHKKEQMDFAVSHLQWTLEDWKRVVQMRQRWTAWGQMGRNGCGKGWGSLSVTG